jgi:hypothetical protein
MAAGRRDTLLNDTLLTKHAKIHSMPMLSIIHGLNQDGFSPSIFILNAFSGETDVDYSMSNEDCVFDQSGC